MVKKRDSKSDRQSMILHLLREFPNNKFSIKHLASASGGNSREGRHETMDILNRLEQEGVVDLCGRDKYRLGGKMRPRLVGRVDMTSTGSVYVKVEGEEQDIFVHQRDSRNALEGDLVEVAVMHTSKSGVREGEILQIIERSQRLYVGVAEVDRHSIFVSCDPRRLPVDIFLTRKRYPEVKDGDKVVVRILDWQEGTKSPSAELVEVLGAEGDNDAEMHAILAEYDLPYNFNEAVLAAAEAIQSEIPQSEISSRRDMRGVPTFTIDPADAKDFDDALSICEIERGVWEVGVHIADVTHYVKPGSKIDKEAESRATSVYLVDRTVPMLPERLCNELCSLRPDEDKLCMSAIFKMNSEGDVLEYWLGRTIIRSCRRFAYEEAQRVIESGEGDYKDEILLLNTIAKKLRAERFKRGAIAFEREEMKFRLDDEGKPLGVYFKVQQEANQLIEEFMLLANRTVAEFCSASIKSGRRVPRAMVYRVHESPSDEKLERFRSFVLRFGHIFKATKGRAVAKEMNKLMKEVRGSKEENAVTMLAVRSMAKAFYTTDNVGHYGLAFPYYTHFTSPIRRYPDMLVHRLLARYLDGEKSADSRALEELCEHSSEREVVAAEAERASIKYKAVEFMSDKIDMEFEGHISGMTDWGVYVELEDTHIEGMIFMRDLPGDFYQFDESRYEVYGHSTGRRLTLGDRVLVRVKRADLRRRTLDFEPVSF